MKQQELTQIIGELKNGNNRILKEILSECGQYCIDNLQRRTTCSEQDAEDILMDAILNFREKALAGKLEYLTSFRNYIYTTCYNMWLVRYEKEKSARKKQPVVERYFYEAAEEIGEISAAEYKEEMLNISNKALEMLDEKCRTIIKYFYLQKMKMDEIAKAMGFSGAAVAKTTKSRCFKKLVENAQKLMHTQNVNE